MSLKSLEDMGGFIKDELVKREITFKLDDGEERTHTIHVRRLSLGEYERLFIGMDEKFGRSATIISQAVSLGDDGSERIPVEKAFRMHKALASPMLDAFTEVNGGKAKN